MNLQFKPLLPGTLLMTLAVWMVFTWPLPRHLFDGIPMSSQNVEKDHIRAMIPGDHLQLLYHFELVRDMLAGRIPWFHNVYEFNTGDDAERFRPGSYFAPFSLTYSLLASLGGRAFGWNLTGLLSLWLTAWATSALLRRFVRHPAAVFAGTLAALALPFRWVNLLGGSPAGLAMMWVPLMALGVDRAIREGRAAGGTLAGVAVLLCGWSDLQVFFFGVLSLPFWAILSFLQRPACRLERRDRLRMVRALLPLILFLALAVLYRTLRHEHLVAADVAGGRSLAEVRLFSPTWRGFWQWAAEGLQSHVYLGYVLPVLLLMALPAMLALVGRKSAVVAAPVSGAGMPTGESAGDRRRTLITYALLGLAILLVLALSLGVNGPFRGAMLRTVRALIPPYAMVRQTAKVFCLLPTLGALALALCLDALGRVPLFSARRPGRWMVPAALLLAAEWRFQVRPTVCLLDPEQAAYAAVSEDAKAAGLKPRALVLPIWPGDSAWASLYEYYVQLYGIRMVNGYSPAVRRDYVENVFRVLESANQGWLTDEQLRQLDRMNVRYVLVLENAFPEKVSPFPIRTTLDRLLAHPRLRLLRQAENVWAFRIEPDGAPRAPEPAAPVSAPCNTPFPARRWEWEASQSERAEIVADEAAGGSGFLRMEQEDGWVETRPARVAPAPGLRWMVRGRGFGEIRTLTLLGERRTTVQMLSLNSDLWTWIELPIQEHDLVQPVQLRFERPAGRVDLDLVLLAAGPWPLEWPVGEQIEWPAACLFHGGYTDADGQSVVFRQRTDPVAAVLYGPKLPLPRGRYAFTLTHTATAPSGSVLGRLNVRTRESDESGWTPVVAGAPTLLNWSAEENLPVQAVFVYHRTHDVTVHRLSIERLYDAP